MRADRTLAEVGRRIVLFFGESSAHQLNVSSRHLPDKPPRHADRPLLRRQTHDLHIRFLLIDESINVKLAAQLD